MMEDEGPVAMVLVPVQGHLPRAASAPPLPGGVLTCVSRITQLPWNAVYNEIVRETSR